MQPNMEEVLDVQNMLHGTFCTKPGMTVNLSVNS